MVADLLPLFVMIAAFLIPIALIGHTINRRRKYCGENFRSCFMCSKTCTHHALERVQDQ